MFLLLLFILFILLSNFALAPRQAWFVPRCVVTFVLNVSPFFRMSSTGNFPFHQVVIDKFHAEHSGLV